MKITPSLDSTTNRKNRIAANRLSLRDGVPLFSIVEISAVAACNRRCSFCPVSSGDYYKNLGLTGIIKDDLYGKLLGDLSDINFSGMILFSGESEPLLHKRLDKLIKKTKATLPACHVEVNSNGDLLTSDKMSHLFDAGLDTLSISLYDGPEQIDQFEQMRESSGVAAEKVILRRRYFHDGDYGIHMTNRGGLINLDPFQSVESPEGLSNQEFPLKKTCFYPFYMMCLDVGGNVTICSHDWAKKFTVGNFATEHLFDIWTGPKFKIAREKLASSDRSLPSCENCDAQGDRIGRDSFEGWLSFYRTDLQVKNAGDETGSSE